MNKTQKLPRWLVALAIGLSLIAGLAYFRRGVGAPETTNMSEPYQAILGEKVQGPRAHDSPLRFYDAKHESANSLPGRTPSLVVKVHDELPLPLERSVLRLEGSWDKGIVREEAELVFWNHQAVSSVGVRPGATYTLSIHGQGYVYVHSETINIDSSDERTVEISLNGACHLKGKIESLPGNGDLRSIGVILDSVGGPATSAVAITTPTGEFGITFIGSIPRIAGFELRLDWGSIPLVAVDGLPAGDPCSASLLVLRPSEELVGLALLDTDGKLLSNAYEVRVVGATTFNGWEQVGGIEILPKRVVVGAKRFIFDVQAIGALGFNAEEAVYLEGSIMAFSKPMAMEASGSIRIVFDRQRGAGEAYPNVEVILTKLDATVGAREPTQARSDRDVLIAGLTPEVYDVYWAWGNGCRRLLAGEVSVRSGEEVTLQVPLVVMRTLKGRVDRWDTIPPDLRPNRISLAGSSAVINSQGLFDADVAFPVPPISYLFRKGIRMEASVRFDESSQLLLVDFDDAGVSLVTISLPIKESGVILGFIGSQQDFGNFVGGSMLFGGKVKSSVARDGRFAVPVQENQRIAAAFYEYDGVDYQTLQLRGWVSQLPSSGDLQVDPPGRLVQVSVRLAGVAEKLRLFAKYESAAGWSPPLTYLGEMAFDSGSEVVWVPREANFLVLTDGRGGHLGTVRLDSTDEEVVF